MYNCTKAIGVKEDLIITLMKFPNFRYDTTAISQKISWEKSKVFQLAFLTVK